MTETEEAPEEAPPVNPFGNRRRRRDEFRMHERFTTTALRLRKGHSKALSKESRAAERATPKWVEANNARRSRI